MYPKDKRQELLANAKQAHQGDWEAKVIGGRLNRIAAHVVSGDIIIAECTASWMVNPSNARHIAATSPKNIIELVEEIGRLEKLLDEMCRT